MNKIRLKFKSVSDIVGSAGLSLLVLTDEGEKKQITIIIDHPTAEQMKLRVTKERDVETSLPEVMWQLLTIHVDLRLEILINCIVGGQYKAIVYDQDTLTPASISIGDAVLLSLVGDVPLYIDESLMYRQSVSYQEGSAGIAIPVNTLNVEMLEDAMKKAIEKEDYELASHLRDEMRRRKMESR